MDGKEMAMNEQQSIGAAKELMVALAQSGALHIQGNGNNSIIDAANRRAEADAEYLATLYRELIAGLQK